MHHFLQPRQRNCANKRAREHDVLPGSAASPLPHTHPSRSTTPTRHRSLHLQVVRPIARVTRCSSRRGLTQQAVTSYNETGMTGNCVRYQERAFNFCRRSLAHCCRTCNQKSLGTATGESTGLRIRGHPRQAKIRARTVAAERREQLVR